MTNDYLELQAFGGVLSAWLCGSVQSVLWQLAGGKINLAETCSLQKKVSQ